MSPRYLLAFLGLAPLLLGGCGTALTGSSDDDGSSAADFTSAWGEENVLAKPPNLLVDVELQLLQITDEDTGRLLPSVAEARLKHEGSFYWLEVDLAPELVWTRTRSFWLEQGFALDMEIPELGVMETDWRQDRSRVLGTGITGLLDAAFERLHDTGERYRFRTRLERGDQPGTTYIFVTARLVEEKANLGNVTFDVLRPDPTLEAEMLRRMLLYLRADEESILTLAEIEEIANRDPLYELSGSQIVIMRDRADAWRRLLAALDRTSFTIVEVSESDGRIVIRSADPTIAREERTFLAQLFFRGQEDGESYEIELSVAPGGDKRTVVFLPDDEVGQRIAPLIADNL